MPAMCIGMSVASGSCNLLCPKLGAQCWSIRAELSLLSTPRCLCTSSLRECSNNVAFLAQAAPVKTLCFRRRRMLSLCEV